MSSWSWRQYAVFRVLFGVYLLVHCLQLMPWGVELFSSAGMLPDAEASPLIGIFPNLLALYDAPWFVTALIGSGAVAALLIIVGRFDRIAALWAWFVLACLFGRNPLIANPSLPVAGWMLLFHALLPRRVEPWDKSPDGSASSVPRLFVFAAWFLLAVAYSYSGWTKFFSPAWVDGETVRYVLENPLARDHALRIWLLATPPWLLESVTIGILWLELLFAPLALFRVLRPWLWAGMLSVQAGFLLLLNFPDLTTPMLLLHLLTFDRAWLSPRRGATGSRLYYDGDCGLCHGWVRFVLAEDRQRAFTFVPLQGASAAVDVPDLVGADDFDSMVVVTPDGERLTRFAAVRYLLASLGGLWRVAAWLLALIPERIGDVGYRLVARHRRRWFKSPAALCPLLPSPWRHRFAR